MTEKLIMLVPKGGLDEIVHRQSLEWEPALFLLGLLLIVIIIILATSDAKNQVPKQPHPRCWQVHAGTYRASCCPQIAGAYHHVHGGWVWQAGSW